MTCVLCPPWTGRWQGGVAAGRYQLMEVGAGCRWRRDLQQWSFAAARYVLVWPRSGPIRGRSRSKGLMRLLNYSAGQQWHASRSSRLDCWRRKKGGGYREMDQLFSAV
jgi:hypothetical protein